MNTLAWVTAAVAGWFWVRALLPRPGGEAGWARAGMEAGLAFAFGTGAASALFFALLWAGMKPGSAAWTADGMVLAAGVGLWRLMRGRVCEQALPPGSGKLPLAWLAGLAAAGSLIAFLGAAAIYLRANPQGDWDAWSVWNTRAKFLASDGMWRNAVSPELAEAHPEQPLLWPAAVARAWSESGAMGQEAPQAGAFLAGLGLLLVFGCGIAARAGWPWAAAATAVLLMLVPLWRGVPGQSADVPLALFLFGAVAAAEAAQRAGWCWPGMALGGALASMAAFTRNEGLLFCAFLGAALAVAARARALWWLAGAAPVLVLTGLFHALLAPETKVFSWESLGQAGRLAAVIQAMAAGIWKMGEWPAHPLLFVALLFLVFRPEHPWRPLWPAVAALLMLAAGALALWASADNVSTEAGAAADRLLLLVIPILIWTAFLWLSSASAAAVAAEPLPDAPRRGAAKGRKG